MENRNIIILKKILRYCEEVEQTNEMFANDREKFFAEDGFIYRNAVCMPILQIGELVGNLSEEFRSTYNQIPWKQIKGMRNIFAHKYGTMDNEVSWNTAQEDIPELKKYIETIIRTD